MISTFRSAAVKNPFFMPIKTGHRFAEAEPTVPTDTLSAARGDGWVRVAAQSSRAAVTTERNKLITVLLPHATPPASAPAISAKPCRHPVAPDSALQFP